MADMRAVILFVLTMAFLSQAALAVEEPPGYRMDDYDAPVPETVAGAYVVDDDAAHALWLTGRVIFFDVMPDIPRPASLPKDVLWQGRKRYSAQGAIWLPYAGFGTLSAENQARFQNDLERHTGGDKSAPMLFLCRADCWMSWNASKRAAAMGYSRVFWYPQGSTGWTFWDWPVERMRPPKD